MPRNLLPPPCDGLEYEVVTGGGESVLSVCFVRQPISSRANAIRVPQVAFRVPVSAGGQPASLLLYLGLHPLLAHLTQLLTGLPTRSVSLDLGSPDGDRRSHSRWRARCDGVALELVAKLGQQPSDHPELATEAGFQHLFSHRPTVTVARGRLRKLAATGGLGSPVPAQTEAQATDLLELLVPGLDRSERQLVGSWFVTPTPPQPIPAEARRSLAASPC